jgi:hypothetical protein
MRKDDVVKYMISLPILNGRIGKWILALSESICNMNRLKLSKGKLWPILLLIIVVQMSQL